MKISIILLLSCFLAYIPGVLSASCQYMAPQSPAITTVSFGQLIIAADLPIGSIIHQQDFNTQGPSALVAICDAPQAVSWGNSQFNRLSTGGNSTYDSGIAGIGIRFMFNKQANTTTSLPYLDNHLSRCKKRIHAFAYCINSFKTITIQLIKTASNTGSGKIADIQLIDASINHLSVIRYQLSNTRIISPSCILSPNHITVRMGKVNARYFNGIGSYSPALSFKLSLQCSNINSLSLIFRGNRASDSTIFELNRHHHRAEGIGLVINHQGKRININQAVKVNRLADTLLHSEYFSAQYIQYAPVIKPGRANLTVTLQLLYP